MTRGKPRPYVPAIVRKKQTVRSTWLSVLAVVAGGCAAAGPEPGTPMEDPALAAERLKERSTVAAPALVRFRWEYADRQGRLSGDGVARVNPPDHFRLDLFSSAEGSLAASLVDSRLATLGQIEDVELPPPGFLYAMAGVFRPGAELPSAGYRSEAEEVLEYRTEGGLRRYRFREGRLVSLEESDGRRSLRRIESSWTVEGPWPEAAEYQDRVAPSRVRWELVESRTAEEPFPSDIYELDGTP